MGLVERILHPFRAPDRGSADEAREAMEAAQERLDAARGRRAEVERRADWARRTREANHLTELFYRGRDQ